MQLHYLQYVENILTFFLKYITTMYCIVHKYTLYLYHNNTLNSEVIIY